SIHMAAHVSWRVLGPALSRGPFPRAASQVINYGKESDPPGLPRGRLIEGEPAPCRGSASGNGEPRPKNRKMTGYPPMTQPSKSFEVETDCAAREELELVINLRTAKALGLEPPTSCWHWPTR